LCEFKILNNIASTKYDTSLLYDYNSISRIASLPKILHNSTRVSALSLIVDFFNTGKSALFIAGALTPNMMQYRPGLYVNCLGSLLILEDE
jgi:hypothetical protein